jgi:hypothetical protein
MSYPFICADLLKPALAGSQKEQAAKTSANPIAKNRIVSSLNFRGPREQQSATRGKAGQSWAAPSSSARSMG